MNPSQHGAPWDLDQSRAQIHEQYLVPAVYAQWAIQITRLAKIDAGFRVIVVGCATGILARMAAEEVGFRGAVVGVDHDPDMLAVAAQRSQAIEWREADAAALPFADESFDRVMSQFMLPHVDNRVAVTREMWRLVRPCGMLVLGLWAPLYTAPAFHALVELAEIRGGPVVARAMSVPWELGFDAPLESTLEAAGIRQFDVRDLKGTARFPGVREMLGAWLCGTAAGRQLKESRYAAIEQAAHDVLKDYRIEGGDIVSALNARVVLARKPA